MLLSKNSARELYIHEDILFILSLINITERSEILKDLLFKNSNEDTEETYENNRFYIRRVLNYKFKTIRALRKCSSIRDKLKIH